MIRAMFAAALAVILVADGSEAQQPERPERPTRAEAQQRFRAAAVPSVGVRGSYDFGTRDFGLGAHAQIPLTTVLRFVPSADVYFGDETLWQANADLALTLLLVRAGGGLALADTRRVGGDGTELGLNLFAGIQSPRPRARIRPFAEARWTFLQDGTPFRLAAGVNIPIRGPR